MSSTYPTNSLIRFYESPDGGTDIYNQTLDEILAWTDAQLERSHDYIQTMFPIPEDSPFNPSAPIIDKLTFEAFRSRPELRERLMQSFVRILRFYGFEPRPVDDTQGWEVVQAANFESASRNWVMKFNHNHLRITRILRSLRVLGLEDEAAAFFEALKTLHHTSEGVLSQRSFMFWTRAATRPLWLGPEDGSEEGEEGMDFLRENAPHKYDRPNSEDQESSKVPDSRG